MDNALEQMLVKNIMENFPEASSSLQCVKWRYDDWKYVFVDEDETVYKLDKEKLLSVKD